MRIALRQMLGEPGERADSRERNLIVEHARCVRLEHLDIEAAEMIGEARPPGHAQAIAELHERPHPARPPSPHEAEMASMPGGEKLGDGVRLAERLGRDEDAFVGEVHEGDYHSLG